MKTKQAIAKRFTKTKKGNILKRTAGKSHFNARESGNTTKNKRRDRTLEHVSAKTISRFF